MCRLCVGLVIALPVEETEFDVSAMEDVSVMEDVSIIAL